MACELLPEAECMTELKIKRTFKSAHCYSSSMEDKLFICVYLTSIYKKRPRREGRNEETRKKREYQLNLTLLKVKDIKKDKSGSSPRRQIGNDSNLAGE